MIGAALTRDGQIEDLEWPTGSATGHRRRQTDRIAGAIETPDVFSGRWPRGLENPNEF